MIFSLAVLVGVIFAVIGIRKGFFTMWLVLFNILVAIYLAVMLSDLIIQIRSDMDQLRYYLAACVAVIAAMTFVILQTITTSFFAEISECLCPKLFDTIGAAALGFLSGYFAFCFVFLVVCIMPFSKQPFMKGLCGDGASTPTVAGHIVNACDFVGKASMQPYVGFEDEHDVKLVDRLVAPDKKAEYLPSETQKTDAE
jgi:uncharacterized membrane protein